MYRRSELTLTEPRCLHKTLFLILHRLLSPYFFDLRFGYLFVINLMYKEIKICKEHQHKT